MVSSGKKEFLRDGDFYTTNFANFEVTNNNERLYQLVTVDEYKGTKAKKQLIGKVPYN